MKQAADVLGKGQRQVRRYADSGALRSSGGGRGVAYSFRKADVLRFRAGGSTYAPRKAWRGVVDANTLGRIAHAASMKRIEGAGHMLTGFRGLWKLPEKTIAGLMRNCLPALGRVPADTLAWAQRTADTLSPAEADYVAAMFAVREYPAVKLEQAEAAALGGALDILKCARPHLFRDETTLQQSAEEWAAIEEGVRAGLAKAKYSTDVRKDAIELKKYAFLDPASRSLAWQLYGNHHPLRHVTEALAGAVHLGDVEEVRQLIMEAPDGTAALYPEADALRASLTALADKFRLLKRQAGRPPSGGQVAEVLGIHHEQGARIVRRIVAKLGQPGVVEIFRRLACDAPRAWKARRGRSTSRPKVSPVQSCPACEATVSETAEVCPDCKRML